MTHAPVIPDLSTQLQRVISGEVHFDSYTRMLYSTDASLYQIEPIGVVIPKNIEDVQATVELAARHHIPLLPRGGGSSLAGQAVGAALVIDFSKYMDQLVSVDVEAKTVTVQPGITLGVLNRLLAKDGLMVGPDPASAERATIGGSVGNNATGSHSILYGMMADNVISANLILADGSLAHVEPLDAESLAAKGRADTLEGRIYRDLPILLHQSMDELIARWPKHWRRASGYNLDRLAAALLPPAERGKLALDTRFRPPACDPRRIDRFNLTQLITGSEGTLAVLTEVTLQLVARPKQTAVAVVHFDRLLDACAAITDILECEPSSSELMDKQMIDLARMQPEWAKKLNFVEGDPAAILQTEFYGNSEAELKQKLDHLETHLRSRGWKGAIRKLVDKKSQDEMWEVRKAGLNILGSRRGDYKPIPGIEDVGVPQERLADYLSKMLDWCTAHNDQAPGSILDVAVYAHASAGCLHVRPLINVKSQQGVEAMQAMADYAVDLCVQYSGAMSGEHGDGLPRSVLNPRLFGPTLYAALQTVKRTFDPHNILNPGKVVDAPPLTDNLRMGPDYQPIELTTVFDWQADHGFAGAIEMCNAAGVCRKLGAGTMCPSYMATKDEHDTTRARANSLRNALAGRIPHKELYSEEMYGVMDLCLGCKACKSECPSSVDMAKIKAEYLVHYYRHNGLPLFNRMMGLLPTLNQVLYRVAGGGRSASSAEPWRVAGSKSSWVIQSVNYVLTSSWFKNIQSKIGVHPQRTLPPYANSTFETLFKTSQFATRHGSAELAERPPPATARLSSPNARPSPLVILFHDTWTNYNEPHIGQAAVRVLESAGYVVRLADGRKCCGRPLITGGQAEQAKAWIDHNVALLAPFAAQGLPIIGIEPSCILTLRDEYLTLASDPKRARLVAQNAFTLEEFIVREHEAGRSFTGFKTNPGKALLHGHCHMKALVGNEPSIAALKLAGYQVEVIPSGCCGMAGDFGYEVSHYEVSRKIGEDRLLPAVRAADPATLVVASGTSCRHQIEHFAGRHAVHLAEALAQALSST